MEKKFGRMGKEMACEFFLKPINVRALRGRVNVSLTPFLIIIGVGKKKRRI